MEIELRITADGDELPEVTEMLSSYLAEEDVKAVVEDERIAELSDEKQIVFEALGREPGSALRVIHQAATQVNGSPFNDYQESDGWNDERLQVREHLWELQELGLARNEGQRWYPTDGHGTADPDEE